MVLNQAAAVMKGSCTKTFKREVGTGQLAGLLLRVQ